MLFFWSEKEEFEMVKEVTDEEIEKAREAMKWLSENRTAWRLAEAEETRRRDEADIMLGAFLEGFRIGFEESILKVRQNGALRLLARKLSHSTIAEITGLSVDEIRQLENTSSSQ